MAELDDEGSYHRLDLDGLSLNGQEVASVEFEQCRLGRTSLAGSTLDRLRMLDCVVEGGDWANLKATRSGLTRVALTTVRLTGLQWLDGVLRDVYFAQCKMDMATLRFTSFKDVLFEGCNLSRADFTSASLSGATFSGCDLSGASFDRADCAGAQFVDCDLGGIAGVESLRGAVVRGADLAALAYTLAGALGITLKPG